MKKLEDSIKKSNFLPTLIMVCVYVFFLFVYTVWYEAKVSSFAFSTWVMFLINAGLVAMIVVGIFSKKKEFVLIPFVIFGVSVLYGSISDVSGVTTFFSDFRNLGSNIAHYKNLGLSVRVNVPTILADLFRGVIGLSALAVFVLFMLGHVILKNEKLSRIGNIILSLIPVAVLVYGLFALISSICRSAWEGRADTIILVGSYSSYIFVQSIAKAALWATLACVASFGLPEKAESTTAKEETSQPTEEPAEAKEETVQTNEQ